MSPRAPPKPILAPDDERGAKAAARDVDELGWILMAAVLLLVAATVVNAFNRNIEAKFVFTYVCCITVTLSGWGLLRAVMRWRARTQRGMFAAFAFVFLFLIALIFYLWPETPGRPPGRPQNSNGRSELKEYP